MVQTRAGRGSEPAWRVLKSAKRAPERALLPVEKALELAGRALKQAGEPWSTLILAGSQTQL